MTDKERLIKLLTYFGVGFEESNKHIRCKDGMNKVYGSPKYFIDYNFDEDGKFVIMGVWE